MDKIRKDVYEFRDNNELYDWISVLDKNIYFGPYPSQCMIERLLQNKFDLIVDLTEGKRSYELENEQYFTFPIKDNSFPKNIFDYCNFISSLAKIYKTGKKIYIHCMGGHGRSSMISISLFCKLGSNLTSAIKTVTLAHNKRVNIRERWKKCSTSINYSQFLFLTRVHKNIYINVDGNKYYGWLSFYDSKPLYEFLMSDNI